VTIKLVLQLGVYDLHEPLMFFLYYPFFKDESDEEDDCEQTKGNSAIGDLSYNIHIYKYIDIHLQRFIYVFFFVS
jgi:hypothetical protein